MAPTASTALLPSEEDHPIGSVDLEFYNEVKAQFGEYITEDFAIRVSRAFRMTKKNRVEVTLTEARRILAWRKELQVDTILKRELDQAKLFFEYWPGYIYGEDNDGHLITVDRISEIQIDGFMKTFSHTDQVIPHRAQYMERIQWEKNAISKRIGKRVYKHICIVDLKGLSLKHCGPAVINHLKPIFDVGQLYYPETLHRLYLVNVPMVFYGIWKVIGNFVDPEVREKIHVFKDVKKFHQDIQKIGVSIDALPTFLGGKHPGRAMNTTFQPSEPDTPLPVIQDFITMLSGASQGQPETPTSS